MNMIAELKKTQVLAETFEFVPRERTVARPVVRQSANRSTPTVPAPVKSVWLALPRATPLENLFQGILIGIGAGAIAYGLALSIGFAGKLALIANWVAALVR